MPETDTYRELAARLGMTINYGDDAHARMFPGGYKNPITDSHAIIRDRAAEALRERVGVLVGKAGGEYRCWCAVFATQEALDKFTAIAEATYEAALLAALDAAGIDARKEAP